MRNIAYLGLDVHARNCVLGNMDDDGEFLGNRDFPTSEKGIINALKSTKARVKHLAIEEGTLARWVAQIASPYVDKVIVCDPRENALIYKSSNKRDKFDTRKLCRLLRFGELKGVYHPESDERAIFKAAVQQYMDLTDQQARVKKKIKAMYRHWGVIFLDHRLYNPKHRERCLQKVKYRNVRSQLNHLYALMDAIEEITKSAFSEMKRLGRRYPEIREFVKISGIGPVGAHVFDAYIQTPHRFATDSRLSKYCRLGITDRTSDGKPLGYKKLDRSGIGHLKAVSFRAFSSSMKSDNEVKSFYLRSLKRTHDHKHARLNTQRKILCVMLSIWKKGEAYQPELFLGST
jgi:transposase